MAYTETDLAAVRAALAKGERSVTFTDRQVVYRSIEELKAAEAHIAASLDTNRTRSRQWTGVSSKGF